MAGAQDADMVQLALHGNYLFIFLSIGTNTKATYQLLSALSDIVQSGYSSTT